MEPPLKKRKSLDNSYTIDLLYTHFNDYKDNYDIGDRRIELYNNIYNKNINDNDFMNKLETKFRENGVIGTKNGCHGKTNRINETTNRRRKKKSFS